jgi:hypothetical protein
LEVSPCKGGIVWDGLWPVFEAGPLIYRGAEVYIPESAIIGYRLVIGIYALSKLIIELVEPIYIRILIGYTLEPFGRAIPNQVKIPYGITLGDILYGMEVRYYN